MHRPTPLTTARDFHIDEMFFSTTDAKGVIRTGNDVFVRVSGYSHEELIGERHNIIRHPEMPRSVFRLVWDYLLRGRPVAGYVRNLAKDGQYYWVVALLMPIENGFLSVRFKPTSPLLATVDGLYRTMLACEQEHDARGEHGSAAMAASEAVLTAALRTLGFADYDAFMCALLHDELKSRDATLARESRRLFPATLGLRDGNVPWASALQQIFDSTNRAYAQINVLYARLDEFSERSEQLATKSRTVLKMTDEFTFMAINASLRSARLGNDGLTLGVLAGHLGTETGLTRGFINDLTTHIDAITARLRTVVFRLAAARLQVEMVLSFCAELAVAPDSQDASADTEYRRTHHRMIDDLRSAFADTVAFALRSLSELDADVGLLSTRSEALRRSIQTLQFVQMGGLIEASRLQNADALSAMFVGLRERIEQTKQELTDLNGINERLGAHGQETTPIAVHIAKAVGDMQLAVQSLSGIAQGPSENAVHTAPAAEAVEAAA